MREEKGGRSGTGDRGSGERVSVGGGGWGRGWGGGEGTVEGQRGGGERGRRSRGEASARGVEDVRGV